MGVYGINSSNQIPNSSKISEVKLQNIELNNKDGLPDYKGEQEADQDTKAYRSQAPKASSIEAIKEAVSANKGFGFNMVGSESRLEDLDISKAISDMQKDVVLQQYQYFVSNSKTMIDQNMNPDSFHS